MGRVPCGVTSALPIFVSYRSSAFLRVIRLIDSWPSWEPFYTLDPWFLATIFLASSYVLTNDIDEGDRCLCPKV
jgi:hypothetical protein